MKLNCIYCNWIGPFSDFEFDHIIPISKGGSDLPQNKQLICSGCNREKGDKTHSEYVSWRLAANLFRFKVNYGPIKAGEGKWI